MFEKFLKRVDPKDLGMQPSGKYIGHFLYDGWNYYRKNIEVLYEA